MADTEMLPALRDLIDDFSRIIDAFEALGGSVVDPRIPCHKLASDRVGGLNRHAAFSTL
jgi:hypothetical protein